MGDRYYLEVICPYCNHKQKELVWYAPTCGFITHECEKCKKIIDLEKYSGIDAESCANTIYGIKAVRELKKKLKKGTALVSESNSAIVKDSEEIKYKRVRGY